MVVEASVGPLLQPGADWDAVLGRFAGAGLGDIYFDHRYTTLYAGAGSSAEAFAFEDGGELFFLPYLRQPVPHEEGLFDFETAYGYGGPLATTTDAEFLDAAWTALERVARDSGLIAGLLRFHPLLATQQYVPEGRIRIVARRDTVVLGCNQPLDAVMGDYPQDLRRRLKKAQREGVEAGPEEGPDALAAFSAFYHGRMRDLNAHEDYHFGDAYFARIPTLGQGTHKVYLCRTDDGTVIGGCLLLYGGRFCHYHLSGSDRQYFRLGPNDVLRHSVIRDHLGGHCDTIHFGGGTTDDDADPLLAFKRKFSRQTARFVAGGCVLAPDAYDAACRRWAERRPQQVEKYGRFILKYRY